jgi:2-dehydropantoate 2-reductase
MSEQGIAVVGTGANGAAIAANMTDAGHDVTGFDQWPAHVEAIRARVSRCARRAARRR